MNRVLFFVLGFFVTMGWVACDSKPPQPEPLVETIPPLERGYWRCFLYPDSLQTENYLPFDLEIRDSLWRFDNAMEYSEQSLRLTMDSVFLQLTDSTSVALRRYSSEMRGVWRFAGGSKEMAMVALPNDGQRFQAPVNRGNLADITGVWEISGKLDSMGIFGRSIYIDHTPTGNAVNADFYQQARLLSFRGDFDGAQFRLSFFDGKRPYLLKGAWRTKGILEGKCWIATDAPITWQLFQTSSERKDPEKRMTFER